MSDKIINLNKEDVNKAEVRYEKEMIKLQIRIIIEIFYLYGDYCIIRMISSLDTAHLGNFLMRKKMMSELK